MIRVDKCLTALLLLGCCCFLACTGSDEKPLAPDASIKTTESAIISGTPVIGHAGGVTLITIDSEGWQWHCSSVILSDTWFLTAKHCLKPQPSTATIHVRAAIQMDSGSETIYYSQMNEDAIYKHPTEDIALVHFPMNPLPGLSFRNPIYYGSDQSLVGSTLSCDGYGYSEYGGGGVPTALYSADLVVNMAGYFSGGLWGDGIPVNGYYLEKNSSGQIQASGDSGSPCFFVNNGTRFVTGITSSVIPDGEIIAGAWQVGAEHFRDWIYSNTNIDIPCIISNVSMQTSDTGATISWNTDRSASNFVQYSLDDSTWLTANSSGEGTTSHQAQIIGLKASTSYRYTLTSQCVKTDSSKVASTGVSSGELKTMVPPWLVPLLSSIFE